MIDFQPDLNKVVQAMLDTGAGPLVLEAANSLVEKWIEARIHFDKKIVAVETGFALWLDEHTVVIGVMDLLTEENGVIVGNEHKTVKGKTQYWSESKWLESISTAPQCAIYALALQHNACLGDVSEFVGMPAVRVRAVTKSDPIEVWPTLKDDKDPGLLTFSSARLESIRNALLTQAAAIRAMRKLRLLPWAVPGIHCVNQFRRECQFLADCKALKYPPNADGFGKPAAFDPQNPAYKIVLPHLGDRVNDPELVILSASSYQDSLQCLEAYRRKLAGNKEQSRDLDVGAVFHTAVAEIFNQLKEFQKCQQPQ